MPVSPASPTVGLLVRHDVSAGLTFRRSAPPCPWEMHWQSGCHRAVTSPRGAPCIWWHSTQLQSSHAGNTLCSTTSRKFQLISLEKGEGRRQPAKRIPPAARDGDSSSEGLKIPQLGKLNLFLRLESPAKEEMTYTPATLHLWFESHAFTYFKCSGCWAVEEL